MNFNRVFISLAIILGFIAGLLEKYLVVEGLIISVVILAICGFFDDE